MTTNQEDLRDVRAALDIEEGLTEWETGFIESLHSQICQRCALSPLQRLKLDEILAEHDK